MTPSRPAILATLSDLLCRTMDLDRSEPLPGATRLSGDMGMTSIDFVALVEAVESHYGRPIPFGELLGALATREDWDVTLDGLAEFVALHVPA